MASFSHKHPSHDEVKTTLTWQGIATALKTLFYYTRNNKQIDFDLIETTQKLQYDMFELIFHQLFLFIDPNETRRRFRTFCLARSQEEQTKFIESAMRFINDKQLHSQRVSSSQLRMLRGGPFRNIITSLIKAASEVEIERNKLNLSIEQQVELEQGRDNLETLLLKCNEKSKKFSSTIQKVNKSMDGLREIQKSFGDSAQAIKDKWSFMTSKIPSGNRRQLIRANGSTEDDISSETNSYNSGSTNQSRDVSPIVKMLLTQLGMSHKRSKMAMEKIFAIKLPRDHDEPLKPGESAIKKRLSQFIREATNKFDTSQEELLHSVQDQTYIKVKQQLIDFDQGIGSLIKTWREEQERLDDELLNVGERCNLFEKLQKLIPQLELIPIGLSNKQLKNVYPKPVLLDIENILKDYPDVRYDDQDIYEVTKRYCSINMEK